MSNAFNYISRDNSLYALSDSDVPRAHDEITTDWVATNSGIATTIDKRRYPLFYTFRLSANTSAPVSFTLNNIPISGVNTEGYNNFRLSGHAIVQTQRTIDVNTTLSVRSTRDSSLTAASSSTTSIPSGILSAVRSGPVHVERKKASIITSALANGSYIKYVAPNSFQDGDIVLISGNSVDSFNFPLSSPATIRFARPDYFVVDGAYYGSSSSQGFAVLADPTSEETSLPFDSYAGENLTASLSFLFTGNVESDEIYITVPHVVDMNRIFASWATQTSLGTTPQVIIDVDSSAEVPWSYARFIHSLVAPLTDVMDKYALLRAVDLSSQPGYVAEGDVITRSVLVDSELAFASYRPWLSQFIGQNKIKRNLYSNKCADYGSTYKVKCATTSSVNLSTELQSGQTCDDVSLNVGDRVLVKNQSPASDNGIYEVNDSSSPTRVDTLSVNSSTIASIEIATPSVGYATIHTDAIHSFEVGNVVFISGIIGEFASGSNGIFKFSYSAGSWNDSETAGVAWDSGTEVLDFFETDSLSGLSDFEAGDIIYFSDEFSDDGEPCWSTVSSVSHSYDSVADYWTTSITLDTAASSSNFDASSSPNAELLEVYTALSALNGHFHVSSIPTSTSFTIETPVFENLTNDTGTAELAIDTTEEPLVFVRKGTVNQLSKWRIESTDGDFPIIGTDALDFVAVQAGARVATTANIDLSAGPEDSDTIDGVLLAADDIVFVRAQDDPTENGVYVVSSSGASSRLSLLSSLVDDFSVFVISGSTYSSSLFDIDSVGSVTQQDTPFAWLNSNDFISWQIRNKWFGYKAGSYESIEEAVKQCLIGGKRVSVVPEPPFGIRVYTLKDETLGIYDAESEITESELIVEATEPLRPMGFSLVAQALDSFDAFVIGTSIIGEGTIG
jgi:hypothetical protein